ncbi:MAG: hypothetical protein VX899_19950 [Myxococcota bacterium]|nr:hypothetical protein [Myxococcota bacterium]
MPAETPLDRAQAFIDALNAGDEDAAMAPCTDDGWELEGDSPGDLFEQAQRKGFQLGAGVVLAEQEGRAAIACPVVIPPEQEGEEERLVGSLHLLVQPSGLAGVAKTSQLAHAFVEGLLSAMPSFEELPESPEASAFVTLLIQAIADGKEQVLSDAASATLENLRVLRQLTHQVEAEGRSLSVGRSYGLPQAGRFCVQIFVDERPMYWMLQRAPGGGLQSRMLSTLPSFERLLDPQPVTPRPV